MKKHYDKYTSIYEVFSTVLNNVCWKIWSHVLLLIFDRATARVAITRCSARNILRYTPHKRAKCRRGIWPWTLRNCCHSMIQFRNHRQFHHHIQHILLWFDINFCRMGAEIIWNCSSSCKLRYIFQARKRYGEG